jgi:hypothetical protein
MIEVIGLVLVNIGYFMRLWVRKRRFERRSSAGLQGYDNFWQAFFIGFFEHVFRLIGSLIGIVGALIAGVGFLLMMVERLSR